MLCQQEQHQSAEFTEIGKGNPMKIIQRTGNAEECPTESYAWKDSYLRYPTGLYSRKKTKTCSYKKLIKHLIKGL